VRASGPSEMTRSPICPEKQVASLTRARSRMEGCAWLLRSNQVRVLSGLR
jgi:hypothetical protein